MSFVVLIVRAPCFSRVSEIRQLSEQSCWRMCGTHFHQYPANHVFACNIAAAVAGTHVPCVVVPVIAFDKRAVLPSFKNNGLPCPMALVKNFCRYILFKKKYSNPVEGHCMKYDACFPSVVQSEVRDTASGVAYCGLGSHRFKSNSSLDAYCIML